MLKFVLAIAAATVAVPAMASDANVTTVVVDTRAQCYTGKIADALRDKAQRKANKIVRELRAEGKTVRVIKLDGRIQMASFANGPVVTVAGC